jgi:hypothetical protein
MIVRRKMLGDPPVGVGLSGILRSVDNEHGVPEDIIEGPGHAGALLSGARGLGLGALERAARSGSRKEDGAGALG